jgi:hypothetical protein
VGDFRLVRSSCSRKHGERAKLGQVSVDGGSKRHHILWTTGRYLSSDGISPSSINYLAAEEDRPRPTRVASPSRLGVDGDYHVRLLRC